jgi:alanine-glyoxylate transaminase/serine-glyoxylate transaminase/serine-pyruvate transaminase
MKPSLAAGRELVAIPGPSVVPDRVLAAMHRPMVDIYSGELLATTDDVYDRLPALARTVSRPFVTISNGHGAWEMALTNTLSRGDKVLVLESGRFAGVWGEMASFIGLDVEIVDEVPRRPVDPADVEARLLADTTHEIKAILVVHVDTATSVRNDIHALRQALDAAGHPAMLMVDCIASLGCEPFEMDAWGVDVTVSASQKGLMMPPGLGFVWAGPKALAAHPSADLRTRYWDWSFRTEDGPHYVRYCGTPPVAHLFGLREALAMIEEEGLDERWARHATLGEAVREAVRAWSTPDGLELHIADPTAHANSVTTIRTGRIDAERLATICRDGAGLTLGIGIGDLAGSSFRIGHMGHVNPPMILGAIGTVEAALAAMEAPVAASGVAAAARVIGHDLR